MAKATFKKSEISPIAHRMVEAEVNFVEMVQDQFGKTKEEAELILKVFIKEKVVKLDVAMGRYNVIHGAFWELEVMNNALEIANQK